MLDWCARCANASETHRLCDVVASGFPAKQLMCGKRHMVHASNKTRRLVSREPRLFSNTSGCSGAGLHSQQRACLGVRKWAGAVGGDGGRNLVKRVVASGDTRFEETEETKYKHGLGDGGVIRPVCCPMGRIQNMVDQEARPRPPPPPPVSGSAPGRLCDWHTWTTSLPPTLIPIKLRCSIPQQRKCGSLSPRGAWSSLNADADSCHCSLHYLPTGIAAPEPLTPEEFSSALIQLR